VEAADGVCNNRQGTAKGKPVARRGRKAGGLEHEIARLPVEQGGYPVLSPTSHLTPAGHSRNSLRLLAALVIALTGAASMLMQAVSADAAETTACNAGTLSTPFSKWGDDNLYALIPGGHFEAGEPAWTLSGGTKLAAGSEPWAVTGSLGKSSLSIPAGGSARSSFICVTPEDRTFRFFDRSEAASGSLLVSIVFQTPKGNVVIKGVALSVANSWLPSEILHTGAAIASAITGKEEVHVALQFESLKGTTRVDDVFLDPRHH